VDDISFKIDVVSTVAYVDVCCSYSGGINCQISRLC